MTKPNFTFETANAKLQEYNLELLVFNTTQKKSKLRCYCGNVFETRLSDVFCGDTQSCGCFRRTETSKRLRKDITGFVQKNGRLSVIEFSHICSWGHTNWKCICECGGYITAPRYRIIGERTKSCGNCRLIRNGVQTSYPALKLHKLLIDSGFNTTEKHHNFKSGKYWIDIPIRVGQSKIAVEYESKYYHDKIKEHDIIRMKFLREKGWKILIVRSSKKIPNISEIKTSINNLLNGSDQETLTLSDY